MLHSVKYDNEINSYYQRVSEEYDFIYFKRKNVSSSNIISKTQYIYRT